jgi:hypothetical protein
LRRSEAVTKPTRSQLRQKDTGNRMTTQPQCAPCSHTTRLRSRRIHAEALIRQATPKQPCGCRGLGCRKKTTQQACLTTGEPPSTHTAHLDTLVPCPQLGVAGRAIAVQLVRLRIHSCRPALERLRVVLDRLWILLVPEGCVAELLLRVCNVHVHVRGLALRLERLLRLVQPLQCVRVPEDRQMRRRQCRQTNESGQTDILPQTGGHVERKMHPDLLLLSQQNIAIANG